MATRWGCLGAGKVSNDFFTAIKDNLPANEHEFVAIAARDNIRAQTFADKFNFKKAYASYEDLEKDSDVEIVYIGTINPPHADQCIRLMHAGKHVLCEKPMAMNLKQAKQVLEVAKRNNVFFLEGIWSQFFPIYGQIRHELSERSVGKVKLLRAEFCKPSSHVDRLTKLELGGGGCLDRGIYVISLACMVFGEIPESITAVGNLLSTGVDENACIILRYRDGAMASLMYHTNAGVGENTAVIYGDKGKMEIGSPFWCPTTLTTPSGSYHFPMKDGEYNFGSSAGFQYEAAAVRSYLKSGAKETMEVPHSQSEMILTIMDEVRRQLGVVYPQDQI